MPHTVHWLEPGLRFEVADGETVLDAALRQQVALPHDCRFGGCGSCRMTLQDGAVDYDELPLALSPEEAESGQVLCCQARPLRDLVLCAPPGAALPPTRRGTARVESLRQLADDVLHLGLRVELPDDEPLAWLPGQYLNVKLPDGRSRSFSMASRPSGDNHVDLHVRRIPGGHFTDRVAPTLRPGERMDVELPLGSFRLRPEAWRPLVMVATGTGLAPIKAMLESLMDDPDCPPVSLYWGARTPADLYLHEQIAGWGERLHDFRYVPVLSRAGADWDGRRGHVQDAVLDDLPDLSEHALYLCGSPAMIETARVAFTLAGAESAHLHSDSFVFQPR
ncbi:2Fe-2S iron-sulfur cluster-binding protein [Leptothrix discophora]|uniref:2Fe-2S iron-sulfur cluster-binding protein n=1 Tax=Leptothrix discophora TaxID=89 RepID=A0ABT9G7I4_LEPDI|nr:2Fe-2S iron-sulfur cluster-binding protein [Leptothrix discophora]MDP4302435.1 2Fe-2S iron-sulfur cluster-binding protein [Leptothrix discophora]